MSRDQGLGGGPRVRILLQGTLRSWRLPEILAKSGENPRGMTSEDFLLDCSVTEVAKREVGGETVSRC